MAEPIQPNVIVNVCHNSIARNGRLPHQWRQNGVHVVVREVPCSGKIDGQYLMHSLEGVSHGVCVVACGTGTCRLAQGNLRAEVRIRTLQRLLKEVGLEPKRAVLLHAEADASAEQLEQQIRKVADQLRALGPSALHGGAKASATRSPRTSEVPVSKISASEAPANAAAGTA